jgi:hypothetical protein
VKEIAFRYDSDQRPVVVDYRQPTLVGFQQKTDSVEQRRIRSNGREPGSHDIRCQHVRHPSIVQWRAVFSVNFDQEAKCILT